MSEREISNNTFLTEISKNVDTLYHLNLNTRDYDLPKIFGKVKVAVTGGTPSRIQKTAKLLHEKYQSKDDLYDYSVAAGRYSLYVVEHVLLFNHGIGCGSASIVFHEILKVLHYAGVKKSALKMIRIGTCGGIGLEAGTICFTRNVLTETMDDMYSFVQCGTVTRTPMFLSESLTEKLAKIATDKCYPHKICKTLGTNDFYLGQGRVDGVFCDYDQKTRFDFLTKLKKEGIENIEMESHVFAAFCNKMNIEGAVMCVVLLNRYGSDFTHDQVTATPEQMGDWIQQSIQILLDFIDLEK